MIAVIKMAGTSPELYSCVAPLVMNPEVIKYNHNYPLKPANCLFGLWHFQTKTIMSWAFSCGNTEKICHNQQLLCGRGCKGCVFEFIGSRDKRISNYGKRVGSSSPKAS